MAFVTGAIGGGGETGGENPQDYILEDTSSVTVQNIAKILGTEFLEGIPQPLLQFQVFNMPGGGNIDLEDPDEWKEEWRDVFAASGSITATALTSSLDLFITLDEVTYVMRQTHPAGTGLVISGNFDFERIRGFLEDNLGWNDGEYRGFEVWGDNDDVSLLEDRGLIVIAPGFVQEFLKALDRVGFVGDDSDLKRALDKVDVANVLSYYGDANCATSRFPTSEINRCEALVEAVEGGGVFESKISGVYVFRNESSAESGRDDVEDSIVDSRYDADVEQIESDEEFVSYQATIHQDYEHTPYAPPTEVPAVTSGMTDLELAQEIIRCGELIKDEEILEILIRYEFDHEFVARTIRGSFSREELLEAYEEIVQGECQE